MSSSRASSLARCASGEVESKSSSIANDATLVYLRESSPEGVTRGHTRSFLDHSARSRSIPSMEPITVTFTFTTANAHYWNHREPTGCRGVDFAFRRDPTPPYRAVDSLLSELVGVWLSWRKRLEALELPILAIVRDFESYVGDPPKVGTHFPMEWSVDLWIRFRYPTSSARTRPSEIFGLMDDIVRRGLLERLPPGPHTAPPSPFHEFRTTDAVATS